MKKVFKRILISFIIVGIMGLSSLIIINYALCSEADKFIISTDENLNVDTIIVLGARVYSDGRLSTMLNDRMVVSLEAYNNGLSNKLLLSGDHGRKNYDEVNSMKLFAEEEGVPKDNIFMDHAGFSTYETMYRAKDIFDVKSAVIVTQDYHLKRAVYIARKLGIEAYGIPCDRHTYPKMSYYKAREYLARYKDFFNVHIFKPEPTYLGEVIPISGTGVLTHDKD